MHTHFFRTHSVFSLFFAGGLASFAAESTDDDSIVDLEPLVVDSAVFERSPDELAQTVTILSDKALHKRVEASIGETLDGSPGVASTYFGPGASRPILRGLDGSNIQIVTNGMGSVDASSLSPDHAASLEPGLAERIEILRGPATLLYGNAAVGGVVNIVDGRIPLTLPEKAIGGLAEVRHGTAADDATGLVDLNGSAGNAGWAVSFLHRDAGDVDIPGFAETEPDDEETPGTLSNSAIETTSGSAGLSWFWKGGLVGASFSTFDTLYGVPGHEHHHEEEEEEEEHHEEGVRIDLKQSRWDVRADWIDPSDMIQRVQVRLGATDYEHRELEGDEVGTVFNADGVELRTEVLHNPISGFEGLLGAQLQQFDLEAEGEEAFIPSSRTRNGGLFLVEEVRQDSLRLQFGGRLEHQKIKLTDGSAITRSDASFSASIGGIWELDETWSFTGTVARTERIPNAQELFADGPHVGTGAYEIGDPGLTMEKSTGFEAGLRKRRGVVTGSLTMFFNDIDDHIVLNPTGTEEDELPVFVYEQENAQYAGVEFEGEWHLHEGPHHGLDLLFGFDYVRAKKLGTSQPLPRIPPFRANVGIAYSGARWSAGADVRHVWDQDRVAEYETPTDGYTLVSAYVSYTIPFRDSELDVFLRGSNLTDEEARPHTSYLKDVAPLPGRDFRGGVRVRF